jgi:hypothetical protein
MRYLPPFHRSEIHRSVGWGVQYLCRLCLRDVGGVEVHRECVDARGIRAHGVGDGLPADCEDGRLWEQR